jgi:hypothetical protein
MGLALGHPGRTGADRHPAAGVWPCQAPLTKIDPRTNTIAATTRIGPWICCLTVGGGYAWAANDSGLWKVADSGDPVAKPRFARYRSGRLRA